MESPQNEQIGTAKPDNPPEPSPLSPSDPSVVPESSPNGLTREEQMAQFEKALKEEDWGHQPC
jgi:hypothetical protein